MIYTFKVFTIAKKMVKFHTWYGMKSFVILSSTTYKYNKNNRGQGNLIPDVNYNHFQKLG